MYNRLERIKQLRWDFGSVLTPEVKYQLSESEVQWFNSYNKCLAGYMRSLGTQGGLDLTQDVKPPRTLYVEVSMPVVGVIPYRLNTDFVPSSIFVS